MRKISIGLLIALIVAGGAAFGALHWIKRTAEREVDVLLDGWRASVGAATRGRVDYDLWTRTIEINDVALQSKIAPGAAMKMARVVAAGVGTAGSAKRIDILDWEFTGAFPGPVVAPMSQKAPRITVEGYAGPPAVPRSVEVASAIDLMRLWLEQFAAITATSITIPSLSTTVALPGPGGRPAEPTEYTYANIALRDVRNGRVAEITADGVTLQGGMSGHPFGRLTGEIGKLSIADFDVTPLIAFLDPTKAKSDGYQRVYGQVAVGPYSIRFENGASMGIDGFTAEDVGLRPSKLSLNDVLFLSEVATPTGMPPSPAQMQMLIEKIASLYEGMRWSKAEMQGLTFNILPDGFKIATLRINGLENGRIAELAMEGLDSQTRRDPVHVGRFALKGLDIANLLRMSTQLGGPGRPPPTSDQLAGMLRLLEGIEIEDFAVPDPKTGRVVHIETFGASWGQFVGVIPSRARIFAKASGPISSVDPEPFKSLADNGIFKLASNFDVGAAWSEGSRALTLAPATIDVGDLFAISAKVSLGNVPADIFSTDLAKVMGAATSVVVAGPIEFSVRDQGGLDLAAAQLARAQGKPPEEGRTVLLEAFTQNTQAASQANPDLQPVFDAIGQFVRSKGETLTIRLTPKGSVGVMQLLEAGKSPDATGVLAAGFAVEAKVGR